MHNDTFLPIPSLNNLYEINKRGEVRNARTKQLLIPLFKFTVGKTCTYRTRESLLVEVHGKKKLGQNTQAIDCSCSDGKKTHYFQSLREMAKFLAPKIRWKRESIVVSLSKRVPKIKNWSLKYFDEPKVISSVGKKFS